MTTVASPPSAPAPAPRPRPQRRGRYVVAIGGCLVAVVAIVVLAVALSENVVYFRTVTEAVNNRQDEGTSRFRMAGAVVKSSVVDTEDGVNFVVSDGKNAATVRHEGDTPALFKPGAPVVVEGRWASTAKDAPFLSDRILIRHGANYAPPKVNAGDSAGSK